MHPGAGLGRGSLGAAFRLPWGKDVEGEMGLRVHSWQPGLLLALSWARASPQP